MLRQKHDMHLAKGVDLLCDAGKNRCLGALAGFEGQIGDLFPEN